MQILTLTHFLDFIRLRIFPTIDHSACLPISRSLPDLIHHAAISILEFMRRYNKTSFIMNIRTKIYQHKKVGGEKVRHRKFLCLPPPGPAAGLAQAARQACAVGEAAREGVIMPEAGGGGRVGAKQRARCAESKL